MKINLKIILSDLKLELAKQTDENKSKDNILSDLKLELAKQTDENNFNLNSLHKAQDEFSRYHTEKSMLRIELKNN